MIVVYCGKTGFTKRYAEWIAEELRCGVLPYRDFSEEIIRTHDVVIFGSRVHAGRIEYLNTVKSKLHDRSKQKLIVFATGATPAAVESAVQKIWADNFSETEIQNIPHFYMQSGLNYEKMGFLDRAIMRTVSWIMSRKKHKNEEEEGFGQAIKSSYDISSKEQIAPLVQYVLGKDHDS